jgi:hypothetical protein
MHLTFSSPATAPVLLSLMGVFGKRLFEPKVLIGEFRLQPIKLSSTGNKREGGAFLFGYFILGKQNKVTRLEAKNSNITTQSLIT